MKYRKTVDGLTIGFALFAMFFGAGNLILPPFLGANAGEDWKISMLGFTFTAIIAPFLGIFAIVRTGNSFIDLGDRINKSFLIILTILIMLILGPCVAIPRTAATTLEVGILPLYPNFSPIVSSICFFSIVFLLSISPSKIVDIIGKFLTPMLLILLTTLIVIGIMSSTDSVIVEAKQRSDTFFTAFSEGYQTMDALTSVIFANIIILSTMSKGYKTLKEKTNITLRAGAVSVFCLFFVYGGLVYLGAKLGGDVVENLSRTNLLLHISDTILGPIGSIPFGLCVSLACLTTAIALTCAVATFFSNLTNNVLSYRLVVTLCCLSSGYFAVKGVEDIINYAAPFLDFVYPIILTIILYIVLTGRFVKSKRPFIGAVIATTIISTIEFIEFLLAKLIVDERDSDIYITMGKYIRDLKAYIPFSQYNLTWVVPSIVFFVLFLLLDTIFNKKPSLQQI